MGIADLGKQAMAPYWARLPRLVELPLLSVVPASLAMTHLGHGQARNGQAWGLHRLTRQKQGFSSALQMSPISMGLQDGHHYVRRTAVLGVLKVYNLDASAVRNAGGLCAGVAGLAARAWKAECTAMEALGCTGPAVGYLHVLRAAMRYCLGLELTSIVPIRVLAPTVASGTSPPSADLPACVHMACGAVLGHIPSNAGMLEDLKTMLQQDPDAQVVANCMSVLLQVSKLVNGCCSCMQHLIHLVCSQPAVMSPLTLALSSI